MNERLIRAESALTLASVEDVFGLCSEYIRVLSEYRSQLRDLKVMSEINLAESSALGRELIDQARRAVSDALSASLAELERACLILSRLTVKDIHDAAIELNKGGFRDSTDWTANRGESECTSGPLSIPAEEAMAIASRLRCKNYIDSYTAES